MGRALGSLFELLESVASSESDGEQVLESVGDHVWHGGSVWQTSAQGESGDSVAVGLEGLQDIFRLDVDDVFVEDVA